MSSQAALLPGESGYQPARAPDVFGAIAGERALRARYKSPDRSVSDATPHRLSRHSMVAIGVGDSGHSLRVLSRLGGLHLVKGERRCAPEAEYALFLPAVAPTWMPRLATHGGNRGFGCGNARRLVQRSAAPW